MLFLALLALTATLIAGSAAFFSVYGLAATFSGTFWSVVVMGASLEAGKLVAASYLYRYWKNTNIFLKSYLMFGVVALMILTSTGIFGYLSAGYQTDSLPLKQLEAQINVLEEEKARKISRKEQIDTQISSLPSQSVRGRERLIRQFKDEQKQVTERINSIDTEILQMKTQIIKTEAHVGPISYIAKAFNLPTDDATKYLILLIIFTFDPMAVALTLAVNIAIRQRELQQQLPEPSSEIDIVPMEPTVILTEDTEPQPVPQPEQTELDPDVPDTNASAMRDIIRNGIEELTTDEYHRLLGYYRYLKSKTNLSVDEARDMVMIENMLDDLNA